MKLAATFFLLSINLWVSGQNRVPVKFSMSNSSSFYKPDFFNPKLKQSADSALIIAAAVLNSQEFIDSISKYSFPCDNYLSNCSARCTNCNNAIPTKVILDSLFRTKRDSLKLTLLNDGRCKGGSFGMSAENKFEVTSYFITINCDDPLPFGYKYAYHLCHEYMHIVGFYHYLNPRQRIRNQDIAEQTGWIAYSILKRWHTDGVKIAGL